MYSGVHSYPCYRCQHRHAVIIILGDLYHMCTQAVLFKRALAYMDLPGVRSPSLSQHNSTVVLHLCQMPVQLRQFALSSWILPSRSSALSALAVCHPQPAKYIMHLE